MIPIAKPIIDEVEKQRVMEVLESGMLSIGSVVKEFEEQFALYTGAKYAVAVSSGTTALHVALLSAGIKPGDKVLTTPFSFVATANSILYCGGVPVFCDIEDETFNIDPVKIREKLEQEKDIKALLIVHLYGHPCQMDEIMKIVQEYNLILVEDAAQAHGCYYKGIHVGNFGKSGIFSFYPTKNMTTGEGGMVITNDEDIYIMLKLLREHGDVAGIQGYQHKVLGYNFRMTNLEAAIGLGQLEKLPRFNARRQENAEYYTANLSHLPWLVCPKTKEKATHCFHQYTLKVENRDRLVQHLKDNGVGSKVYYPITIPEQTMYKDMGYNSYDLPVSKKMTQLVVSIPVHPAITVEDREKIVSAIKSFTS